MKLIGIAAAAFASTNVDDLFLLMMFFALARTSKERRAVVIGQYLGIATLVAAAIIVSGLIRQIPGQPERCLGFIPFAMGAVELIRALCGKHDGHLSTEPEARRARQVNVSTVMVFCITDGADNLSVYIPLFARFATSQITVIVLVFAVMVGGWCIAGYALGQAPPIQRVIRRWENILVPIVMMAIGLLLIL